MTTAAIRRSAKGNLPVEITSLVGRRSQTTEIKRLLSGARLVTLTGIGGVGKTRLAIHVGAELRRIYPDGVWLIEFATVRDPALVARTVANTLGIGDQSTRDLDSVLIESLRDQHLLLIFDNCEHLVEPCAELAAALLRSGERVQILATSRQLLGVAGEHPWSVPPLTTPDVSRPLELSDGESSAMTLFAERAAAAVPGFTINEENQRTIAEICYQLDGLPLAIEMAAARLRALPPEELLIRLDHRYRLLTGGARTATPRQQTLRGAIDWSFDLCTLEEQLMWSRVSVFADSFDLSAVEAVCRGDGIEHEDILDLLAGLVDKSVLAFHQDAGQAPRYRLLETVREYGQDRLRDAGQEAIMRRRHRDWYLSLAEQAEEKWFGPNQADTFARMKSEQANLRAALDFCLNTPGEARIGLYLLVALRFFWSAAGYLPEGRLWFDRSLAIDPEPSRERANALWVAGRIAVLQGDVPAAVSRLEECRDIALRLGDDSVLAHVAYVSGLVALLSDDLAAAAVLLEEGLARFQVLGEIGPIPIMNRAHLAHVCAFRGLADRAVELCQEARSICETSGEQWALSLVLYALAYAEWSRGDIAGASKHARDSLRIKRNFDDLAGIASVIELMTLIAVTGKDERRAARLLGVSEGLWTAMGVVPRFGIRPLSDVHRAAVEEAMRVLGRQAFDAAFGSGVDLPLRRAITDAVGELTDAPEAERDQVHRASAAALTRREREVAELVAAGLSNREIATKLVISQRTAETHVEHILTKLGFTSRAQIAVLISERNLS